MVKKRKPTAKPEPPRSSAATSVLSVRGSNAWRAWLNRLAEFDRATVADVVDRALADYGRTIGFKEVPPKR